MTLGSMYKVALKSILKNRMRSLLTSLGIIIGVCSVIVMVAMGKGSQVTIEKQIASLGSNLIIVFPGSSSMGGVHHGEGSNNRLTLENADSIKEKSVFISKISPLVNANAQIVSQYGNWNCQIQGVSETYPEIRNWEIKFGSWFTERDVQAKKKVAVIGKTVVDNLFPGKDPIGEKIRINNTPFTVIGVVKEKGQNAMGNDQDNIIFSPSTTVLYRLKGGNRINAIMASASSSKEMQAAMDEITAILRTEHKIAVGKDDDFTVRNQSEISDMATSTSKTLTILLGAIAFVSLIVGGIGIMNIMLVSVTERTREIGIRMAIGARKQDVLIQFLVEAIMLSVAGGLLGVMLAVLIALVMNSISPLYFVISWQIIVISVMFSAAVGVFFGYYPAKKAANLNPIEALRYE